VQLVARDRPHAHPPIRLEGDEAERRQPPQRLTDRRPADREALGQVLLPQHDPRPELAGDDLALEHRRDLVRLGALEGHASIQAARRPAA
jgi:hypothetical protein